jgi:hypothetical protein
MLLLRWSCTSARIKVMPLFPLSDVQCLLSDVAMNLVNDPLVDPKKKFRQWTVD